MRPNDCVSVQHETTGSFPLPPQFSTMRVLTRISDEACAGLIQRVVPLLGGMSVSPLRAGRAAAERASRDGQLLIVDDLMPDPVQQIEWLHRLHAGSPHLSLFLLLPPHGAALRELALRGAGLPL